MSKLTSAPQGIKYECRQAQKNAKGFRISHVNNDNARQLMNTNSVSAVSKHDDVYKNLDSQIEFDSHENNNDTFESIGLK